MVVTCHVGSGHWTQVLWKSGWSSYLLSHFSSLHVYLTFELGSLTECRFYWLRRQDGQGAPGFTSLLLQHKGYRVLWLFMWVLGSQTQVFLFIQQTGSPLSHLPSSIVTVCGSSDLCCGVTIGIYNIKRKTCVLKTKLYICSRFDQSHTCAQL